MFTAQQRSRMRTTTTDTMLDQCQHLAYGATTDTYGEPVDTYTPALTYVCGFAPGKSTEQYGGSTDARTSVVTLPRIRLPLSARGVVTARDRLLLTVQFEETLVTPETFEVVGDPRPGPTAITADVRRVTL